MGEEMKTKLKLGLVYILLSGSTVIAGTQAIMQGDGSGKNSNDTTQISVEGTLLRIDNTGSDGSQVIFDTAKKEMLMIDHKERSFMRMNKAYLDNVKKQMEVAFKQMDAQMAKMPQAQREMMKKMMGNKMNMFNKPQKKQNTF